MTNFSFKKTAVASSIIALLFTAAPMVSAESFGGLVKGHITAGDNSDLSDATIVLKHKGKGFTRTIKTDSNGHYLLRKLPIGKYSLTILKDGYISHSEDEINVVVGNAAIIDLSLYSIGSDIERIAVTGNVFRRVDTASSSGGMSLDADELAMLPVDNGFESMVLLAPGASSNSEFDAASIGGSSSAENGYYLNGLNVTSIRKGIGSISLPWEAIAQSDIKTGGVDPEFGGAMGGIVNAVSKSGSNDFTFGAQLRVDPESLRSHHVNLQTLSGDVTSSSQYDTKTYTEARIWASGALIEDKLFAYGLFSPRKTNYDNRKVTTDNDGEDTSDRWFAKIDWFITDEHVLEFTGMSFKENGSGTTFAYDVATNQVGDKSSIYKSKAGGEVFGVKYTGQLSDSVSIDVIAGRTKEQEFNSATSSLPGVWDERSGTTVTLSKHSASQITDATFIRDQFRVDLSWDLDDHALKFGIDSYKISVDYAKSQNGIGDAQAWWTVKTAGAGDRSGQVAGNDYIEKRIRTTFTDSDAKSTAIYVQDSWQTTDNLVLNIGLRYSEQSNSVSDGRKYVDIKGQFAPRLQAIYDLSGDGSSKLFATYGRYFQPVSANMNITQGSTQRETFNYFELSDVDSNGAPVLKSDGSPVRGAELRDMYVRQKGIDEPGLIASANLDSMYSDEFTLGYQQEVFEVDMTAGVRFVYRDLKRSVEDTDVAPVLAKYFKANNITDNVGQGSYYVLLNPGTDLQMSYDFDGDGQIDTINISAEDMAMPKPTRKYAALEFTLAGKATDKLNINASYTWSHGWGNTEGLVKTDNGQADPGWTTSYDYADLMDHATGNLPNDRRHAIKFSGSYKLTEDLVLGFASRINSGRPLSKLGYHPVNVDTCAKGSVWDSCVSQWYGATSFYDADGNAAPRGGAGKTPWTKEVDMSLLYTTNLFDGNLSFKATVYNVLNSDTPVSLQERHAIRNGDGDSVVNPEWSRTKARIGARYVSLTARYEF